MPRAARLTGPSGSVVHALSTAGQSRGPRPEGERPPYIVWVHGGPTAQVVPRLDLEKAFFTSRGIGIIDVNYGGSSGSAAPTASGCAASGVSWTWPTR